MLNLNSQTVARWIISMVLVLGMNYFSSAQDIHYSQFYNSPLNINPGLTGIFNGDIRFLGNYRSQWYTDNLGRYMTFTAAADKKFYPKDRSKGNFWSGGLLFNYDLAGDSKLSVGHLGVSGSYTWQFSTNNFLSLGGLAGVSQRRFKLEDLMWDNQWDGFKRDPDRPSGENFESTSNFFVDLSAGLNYRWQKSPRTKFDIGLGAFHLNQPDQSFIEDAVKDQLPIRLSTYAITSWRLARLFDLLVHANAQFQGPYDEVVIGAFGKVYLNQRKGAELALSLGAGYRFGDAVIPKIAVDYGPWHGEFSFDINISDFDVATRGRGGPEFTLIYIITKVQPLGAFKNCPLY